MGAERKPRRRRSTSVGSVSVINGDPNKWRAKVYVDGKQRTIPGGPWPTEEAGNEALRLWNARRVVAEAEGTPIDELLSRVVPPRHGNDAPASDPASSSTVAPQSLDKSQTPFRQVYLNSLARKGGEAGMSADRRAFYRCCITGEAKTKTGEVIVGRMILGNLPVGRISVEVIENWAASLLFNDNETLRLKPATVAKYGRHLGQALKWAKSAGYIQDNPMEQAEVVARGELTRSRQPRYVFTLDEMWVLREAVSDPTEKLMAEVLMWSGLRQGELRALTPESLVGRAVPLLQVSHSVNAARGKPVLGATKTDGSERRVPIPARLMVRLKEHAQQIKPGHPLFPSPTSEDGWMRSEWFNRRFRAWCDAAGLVGNAFDPRKGRRVAPTPHGLRATAASVLFAAGATVPEVQAFLGHKQPLMTLQVYTEVKGFGDEDPVMLACRGQGMTVAQILDYVYEAMFTRGVLGLRETRPDDASAFVAAREQDLTAGFRDDVTRLVVDLARQNRNDAGRRDAPATRTLSEPPQRVSARRPTSAIETRDAN